MHVKDRTVLLRAFGKVLGKRDVEIATSDKVCCYPGPLGALYESHKRLSETIMQNDTFHHFTDKRWTHKCSLKCGRAWGYL